MAYKFTETNKVNEKFAKVFGIGFKPFYDGLVSVATKQLWIDIVKFDEWLQKKHGDYDGKSMMDVVREHYGYEGVRLVDELTGNDEPEEPKGGKQEVKSKKQKPQETMEPKKVNERIAMAMLRQCALVWEYCTVLAKPVVQCECKFSDIYKGMYGKTTQRNDAPIGRIDVDVDECQYYDVFVQKMREVKGVTEYNERTQMVSMFFQTSDTDPQMGFGCSYGVERVFDVASDLCTKSLLDKTVFGIDSSGKFARLPEVTQTKAKAKAKTSKPKQAAKASGTNNSQVVTKQPENCYQTTTEPTLAERLREALLRQMKQAA